MKVHIVKERKRCNKDELLMFCGVRTSQNPELSYVEYPLGAKRVEGLCEECRKMAKKVALELPDAVNRKSRVRTVKKIYRRGECSNDSER